MADEAVVRTPSHLLAHLSDLHLLAGDRLLAGRVDTVHQLQQAMARLHESGEALDAIVLSGDLADTADPEAYSLLRQIVQPVADRLGAALVMTGGNHDERRPMAHVLYGAPSDEPHDAVTTVRGLRLISMDSAVPGYHHGGFSDAQYAWLSQKLASRAEHGSVLLMHHPPITYRSATMALLDFDEPRRLQRVLEGSDVRVILCGHLHVTTYGSLAGIPVVVAGGVSYVDDVSVPREQMMALDGPQSWNLVELYSPTTTATATTKTTAGAAGLAPEAAVHGEVVVSVAPVTRRSTWPALSEAVREFMATVPEQDRRETLSRKRFG